MSCMPAASSKTARDPTCCALPRHPYTRGLLDALPHGSSGDHPLARCPARRRRSALPAGCAFHPRCALRRGYLPGRRARPDAARRRPARSPAPSTRSGGAGMSLLSIRDLVVRYRGHSGATGTAVAGVDLDVEEGQIVALVGESGCGKSSLGKAAVGLIGQPRAASPSMASRSCRSGSSARPRRSAGCRWCSRIRFPRSIRAARIADLIGDGAARLGRAWRASGLSVGECLERVGLPARDRRSLPASVLRRPAPAHCHRPRARRPAALHHRRRTDLGARRLRAGLDRQPACRSGRRSQGRPAVHLA